MYERKGTYNGYSIVDLGPDGQIAARYRTYYVDRLDFDEGTNVAPAGIFYNSAEAEAYWNANSSPLDNEDICLWLMETEKSVIAELDITITTRSLTDTFIDPVIMIKQEDGTSARLTPAQIVQGKDNLAIAAASEYGATALLSWLTLEFHRQCDALPRAVAPSFVDAKRIRTSYPAIVTNMLRSGLPESDHQELKLQSLHNSDRLVALIDNVDPANAEHQSFLRTLRTLYPKARIILAATIPFLNLEHLTPVLGVNNFQFAQIGTLTRGRVRRLVEKWNLPAQYQADTVVEHIHSQFIALGIPLTAAYVVIYLSVLEDIQGYNPINSSTVIEQFVETALQKYKPTYVFRSAFDYRNQIDYLGAIAERMCRENLFVVEYEQLYTWTKEYFEALGIEHDYQKLIEHFVAAKVFSLEANSVYFKYNLFLSFFIAHQMLQSSEFKSWVLEDFRYTKFIAEVDIYCGLSRKDAAILQVFSTNFEHLSAELKGFVEPLNWTDRLEKLSLPAAKKTDTEEFTDRITRQLVSDMPAEARDEQVSQQVVSRSVTPDRKRPEFEGILERWILTLRAMTVSLKNLENLNKTEKEKALTIILQGWSTITLYACILFQEIIDKREVDIGPLKFRLFLPEKFDARFIRRLFVTIPVYISDLLRRDLGSQKLALQLKNDELAKSLSDSFLQTSLYADLKLPEYLNRLKALRQKAADADAIVFLEALLSKMRDIFLRLGIQKDEHDAFIRMAAELSADIKGLSGGDRQREIDHFTGELRKREQVNKLRDAR